MGATFKTSLHKGFFFLILFISLISQSQFHNGLELGVNMTNPNFSVNDSAEPSSGFGFSLGYVGERDFSENLFIRVGVNYVRREFNAISRLGINTSEETWGIDAVEVPINLGYYLNWNNRNFQFFVDAGINLEYNGRVFIKNDAETILLDIGNDAEINRLTFGANAGVGLLFKKRVKVRLNYYNSLSNIVNIEGGIWKNRSLGLSLNYFFKEKLEE